MKTRRPLRRLLALALLALLALVTTAATACRHHDRHAPPQTQEEARDRMMERTEEALDAMDADPSQRKELRQITQRVADRFWAQHADRQELHQWAMQQLQQQSLDEQGARQRLKEKIEAVSKAAHLTVDDVLQAHGVLRPEQRAQLADLIDERHQAHKDRFSERSDFREMMLEGALRKLDADKQQEALAYALRDTLLDQHQATRRERELRHDAVRAELLSDAPDAQVLHQAIDDTAAQMLQSGELILGRVQALADTLRPEQWETLEKLAQRFHKRH